MTFHPFRNNKLHIHVAYCCIRPLFWHSCSMSCLTTLESWHPNKIWRIDSYQWDWLRLHCLVSQTYYRVLHILAEIPTYFLKKPFFAALLHRATWAATSARAKVVAVRAKERGRRRQRLRQSLGDHCRVVKLPEIHRFFLVEELGMCWSSMELTIKKMFFFVSEVQYFCIKIDGFPSNSIQ